MLSNQVLQRAVSEMEAIAGEHAQYGPLTDTGSYCPVPRVREQQKG